MPKAFSRVAACARLLSIASTFSATVLVYGIRTAGFSAPATIIKKSISAALASMANAKQKDGFVFDARGYVQATNPAARKWLEMGVFDDLKRQGTRTYQEIMLEIIGCSGAEHRYVLELSEDERARGRA